MNAKYDDGLSVSRVFRPPEAAKSRALGFTAMWRGLLLAVVLLLLSAGCYQLSQTAFPQLDERAATYFVEVSQKTVVSYALVRSANAVVSVIQESELQLAPAGVGVNVAVGQILDPLNDLLERASSLLLVALLSTGVQRVMLELGNSMVLQAAAVLLLLCVPLLLVGRVGASAMQWLLRAAVLLVLLRVALPASAVLYDESYQRWFAPQIEEAETILKVIPGSDQFSLSYDAQAPGNGMLANLVPDIIRQQAVDAEEKLRWLRESFLLLIKHAASLVDALLQMLSAYAAMFALQVLVLPVTLLWLVLGISRVLSELCLRWLYPSKQEK